MTMTKMTASPIPMDALMLFDIPKKEQSAMNRMRSMLLTSIAERKIKKKFISLEIIL
jgi:hypothetical protein